MINPKTNMNWQPLPPTSLFTPEQVTANLQVCFTDLVERYQPLFYRKALSILHRHDLAENTVQDTFLNIYEACLLGSAEERCKWLAPRWIYRCVENRAKNIRKRELWLASFDWSEIPWASEQRSSRLDFPDIMAIFRESVRTLHALVNSLRERKVIYLHFFEGYSYEEISQRLGIPSATLRQQVRRCLKRLVDQVVQAKLTSRDVAERILPKSDQRKGDNDPLEILLVYLFYACPADFTGTNIFSVNEELLELGLLLVGTQSLGFPYAWFFNG